MNLPQDTPPPAPKTSPTPVWNDPGRPARGSDGEINWWRGKISGILRNGPTFGPRKDEYLPYLVVRANSSDRGNRKLSGVFWESPDIFVAPNLDWSAAPLMPPTFGGLALASRPNTLYAHVWNLGNAPARHVRVEFYWFNPSLGISRSDSHLIGAAYVDLGNRFSHFSDWVTVTGPSGAYLSRGAHAIVRCPVTWFPTFENNGHECLVVRAFDGMMDTLSPDQFSSQADRHVAQRNIAVAFSQSPAEIDLPLDLGYMRTPGEATVDVEVATPATMEFLKLYVGPGGKPVGAATEPLVAGLLPPTLRSARMPALSLIELDCRGPLVRHSERFQRGCEPVKIGLHTGVRQLPPGVAYVVRVRQRQDDQIVGGYSVVLLGH